MKLWKFNASKKRIVINILLCKIAISLIFSSGFQRDIFIPFVSIFLKSFSNPWAEICQSNQGIIAFPYPPLMLYALSPFVFLINLFGIENFLLVNFIFKIPLYLSDILCFYLLCKLFPDKFKEIILFYFLNPIIIYINYIHTQLDLIPTSILFLSAFLLIRKRNILSFIILGISIGIKFHTVFALPVIFIYILKKYRSRLLMCYSIFIPLVIYFLASLPFIFSREYQFFVLNNPEQTLILETFLMIQDLKLYILPLCFMLLLSRLFAYSKINNDLFLTFLGVLFASFILLIYPNPGWYAWSAPYLAIIYIKKYHEKKSLILLFYMTSLLYLIYFICIYRHPFNDITNLIFLSFPVRFDTVSEKYSYLIFTALESFVLLNVYILYQHGIKSNLLFKRSFQSLLIGIAGDSAAGKSTILQDISLLLGEKKVICIEGDGEHKWERGHSKWEKYTHLNPKANYLYRQFEHIKKLKDGEHTRRVDYDHSIGIFSTPKTIKSNDFIVLSGLHPFYLPKARMLIDLKIYIDTDEKLRKHWKMVRDVSERGHDRNKVFKQLEEREEDARKYIHPQKNFADLIIKYSPLDDFELGSPDTNIDLSLEIHFDSGINIDVLLHEFDKIESMNYIHDFSSDLTKQILIFNGKIDDYKVEEIAYKLINNMDELISHTSTWQSGYRGIVQLFFLICAIELLEAN